MNYHLPNCATPGCPNHKQSLGIFCSLCQFNSAQTAKQVQDPQIVGPVNVRAQIPKDKDPTKMSFKYPKYYKDVSGLDEVDVYAVHQLFNIQDPSGAIQHASKKLLLSGVRTGGKTKLQDITEARDTLTRWIQLNQSKAEAPGIN